MQARKGFAALLALTLFACGDSPTEPEPDPNQAPNVSINSPSDGATVLKGDTIQFQGSATDREDGRLEGEALVWRSSKDGRLAEGRSFRSPELSVGEHTIILTATDSNGATGSDSVQITIQEITSPSVELGIKLPRDDLDFDERAKMAYGEAALLGWNTEGDRLECQASGRWEGAKKVSGRDTTNGLQGPKDYTFIMECKNSKGLDADTAKAEVAAPREKRPTSNRPNETDEPLVKLFYILPKDVEKNKLLSGEIEEYFRKFQRRFEEQTGRRFRVDSFGDIYDVTFIRLDSTENTVDGGNIHQIILQEFEKRGIKDQREIDDLIYLKYYDGRMEGDRCGITGFVFLDSDSACSTDIIPTTSGHELLHDLGFSHVDDHEKDLMYPILSNHNEFIVDHNRDDYYNEDGLPDNIKNLANSPFLTK